MINSVLQLIQNFLTYVISLFPHSPFRSFIDNFSGLEYLGWVNWFFPVGQCLAVLSAWLVAVGTFYLWSILARWVKLIGD